VFNAAPNASDSIGDKDREGFPKLEAAWFEPQETANNAGTTRVARTKAGSRVFIQKVFPDSYFYRKNGPLNYYLLSTFYYRLSWISIV
jgi:hypothetical protein